MARETRKQRQARLGDFVDPQKNLRQAKFFLGLLEIERAKPFMVELEPMDFLFSACINAAVAVWYALESRFGKDFDRAWKDAHPADVDFFDRMRDLRTEDVHYGVLEAASAEHWTQARPPHAILTVEEDAVVERKNTDGNVVRGPALTCGRTISIEIAGVSIEGIAACRCLISLMDDLAAAVMPRLTD